MQSQNNPVPYNQNIGSVIGSFGAQQAVGTFYGDVTFAGDSENSKGSYIPLNLICIG